MGQLGRAKCGLPPSHRSDHHHPRLRSVARGDDRATAAAATARRRCPVLRRRRAPTSCCRLFPPPILSLLPPRRTRRRQQIRGSPLLSRFLPSAQPQRGPSALPALRSKDYGSERKAGKHQRPTTTAAGLHKVLRRALVLLLAITPDAVLLPVWGF
ncbi:hypothetical protein U9M48_041720 [Paspalum notatum var. saurae]|uniref:Uncharacterized protein n=1 Tax=Paspalum notatum var. saurae TaxID=547442 RepID=A0AAQ3UPV3_PASNO